MRLIHPIRMLGILACFCVTAVMFSPVQVSAVPLDNYHLEAGSFQHAADYLKSASAFENHIDNLQLRNGTDQDILNTRSLCDPNDRARLAIKVSAAKHTYNFDQRARSVWKRIEVGWAA